MVYITVKQPPMYHQMTLEEFLFQTDAPAMALNPNLTNTKTYEVFSVSDRMARKFNFSVPHLIAKLSEFNRQTQPLRQRPRHELYREFHIPKKSGGLRKIDAPNRPACADLLRNRSRTTSPSLTCSTRNGSDPTARNGIPPSPR